MRLPTIGLATSLVFLAGLAAHAADQDFTLYNDTGYTIDKVFVSPVSKSSWGSDILGTDQLENGRKVAITFRKSSADCRWDLRVVYDDDDEATWNDINLCQLSNIHLHWDKKAGTTRATGD